MIKALKRILNRFNYLILFGWARKPKKKQRAPFKAVGYVLDVEETPKGLLVTFFLDDEGFEKMMRKALQ